jgi:iron complex outermembrane receptor protein
MPKRTRVARAVLLALSGCAATAAGVRAQDAQVSQAMERVEITGSSIKRIEGETALPVTIITRKEIERTGATNTSELLEKVSATNGQGYNVSLALGDAARPGFSAASLRGLGSNSTLVLLNGRRLVNYAFDGGSVDLNAIPLSAIDRVEVLRDGASAIYGTDAVGGVINFITRKDYSGVDASVYTSRPQAKGGKFTEGTFAFGYGDPAQNRFNVFGVVTVGKQDRIKALDRDFAKTSYLPNDGIDKLSFNSIPANVFTTDFLNGGNPYAPNCSPPYSFHPAGNPNFIFDPNDPNSPLFCGFDYTSTIDILPEAKRSAGIARATFEPTPDNRLFAEATYARNVQTFRVSPTPVSTVTTFAGQSVLYPAGGPYYPGNGIVPAIPGVTLTGDLEVFWRALSAGPRTNEVTADQTRFVFGGEGTIAGWDYNAALWRAQSKAHERYTDGYLLESRIVPAMFTGEINPFGEQTAAGQALVDGSKFIGDTRISKGTTATLDGRVSRELASLPAGPLSMAVGAESRKEKFDDNPLPILNTGDIIGSGGNQLPVNADRTVRAAFLEFAVPIVRKLDAQLAVRYDHYSDFGSSTNPKVALRWQPSDMWLLRGSANTGFRAPTLPDLYAPLAQTNTGNPWDDPLRCRANGLPPNPNDCNNQFNVRQGGNPNLKPEKSRQLSAGFVFEPTRDISISADYYRIRIENLIGLTGADVKMQDYVNNNGGGVFAGDIVRTQPGVDPSTGLPYPISYVLDVFDNLGTTRTSGYDLGLRWRMGTTPFGTWRLGFEGTYISRFDQQTKAAPVFASVLGAYAQFGPIARFRHNTTLTWEVASFSTALTYNYQSRYLDQFPDVNGNPRQVGVYETFDLQTLYEGIKNLKIAVGVRNLFDRDPPLSNQGDYFQVGYDPTYTDPRGRTYYLRLSYKFY